MCDVLGHPAISTPSAAVLLSLQHPYTVSLQGVTTLIIPGRVSVSGERKKNNNRTKKKKKRRGVVKIQAMETCRMIHSILLKDKLDWAINREMQFKANTHNKNCWRSRSRRVCVWSQDNSSIYSCRLQFKITEKKNYAIIEHGNMHRASPWMRGAWHLTHPLGPVVFIYSSLR